MRASCGIQDSLDDQFAAPALADPVDVFPGELGIELFADPRRQRRHVANALDVTDDVTKPVAPGGEHIQAPARPRQNLQRRIQRRFGRGAQAVADIVVALAENLQVQGQHQCAAAGIFGSIDQATDEIAVLHHVKLEPEGFAGVFGYIFDRADAHGRQGETARRIFPRRGPP